MPPAWQAPPQPPPTVAKVPLLPGERVLYFKKPDQGATRIGYVLAGILLTPLLLGIWLLYVAWKFGEQQAHYYVITTHRLFTVNAVGGVMEQVDVPAISDLTHRMGNGTYELIVKSERTWLKFRREEQHDVDALKALVAGLRNPTFVAHLPNVPFEA
jgi:hypothetical protein